MTAITTQRPIAAPAIRRRETIDGPEKLCLVCGEWWPADGEFYYPSKRTADGLFYCCKACYREKRNGREAKAPTSVSASGYTSALVRYPENESAQSCPTP